jgi:hypothetical protein
MGLIEDFKSGKYNLVLFGIIFALIFYQFWLKDTKEPMADVTSLTEDKIKELIYKTYLIDVTAIKNLSDIAKELQSNKGLTIPGDLTIKGKLIAGGEISNNSFSLSGLNNSVNAARNEFSNNLNNTVTATRNELNNTITNTRNQIFGILDTKYDKSGGPISGDVRINGYLTGNNFTMHTGGGNTIQTQGGTGQFIANGRVYFGAGACHGNTSRWGACP